MPAPSVPPGNPAQPWPSCGHPPWGITAGWGGPGNPFFGVSLLPHILEECQNLGDREILFLGFSCSCPAWGSDGVWGGGWEILVLRFSCSHPACGSAGVWDAPNREALLKANPKQGQEMLFMRFSCSCPTLGSTRGLERGRKSYFGVSLLPPSLEECQSLGAGKSSFWGCPAPAQPGVWGRDAGKSYFWGFSCSCPAWG